MPNLFQHKIKNREFFSDKEMWIHSVIRNCGSFPQLICPTWHVYCQSGQNTLTVLKIQSAELFLSQWSQLRKLWQLISMARSLISLILCLTILKIQNDWPSYSNMVASSNWTMNFIILECKVTNSALKLNPVFSKLVNRNKIQTEINGKNISQ